MLSQEIVLNDEDGESVGVARNVPGGVLVILTNREPVYIPRLHCTSEGILDSLSPKNLMTRWNS